MAVEVALGTPLAETLSSLVQPKLIDLGWSTEDDSSLAEYIILMLVNGKTQDQVASELSSDLLPDETGTVDFAKWLFDQVSRLKGGPTQNPSSSDSAMLQQSSAQSAIPVEGGAQSEQGADSEMQEATNTSIEGPVPTGPKAMRGARAGSRGGSGGGRMVGQINRAMDRSADSVLHRIKPQTGSERINSHSREPPRGPKSSMSRNVRGSMNRAMGPAGMQSSPAMNGFQQSPMAPMTPQQQMEFMTMLHQTANMMAPFMPGMMSPTANPVFQNDTSQSQQGKSLFDRVEPRGRNGNVRKQNQNQNGRGGAKSAPEDAAMDLGEANTKQETDPSSSMEVESSQNQEVSSQNMVCHFNLKCTRKDCPYAHQSPAAPEGTTVDPSDVCPFGAACKNFKCTGRHPSPSQKASFQSEEQCKFFPHCTNPKCPFKHPTMPMCRNGADCSVPHCKFTHLQTPCKFNPCLNPKCPFKHADGQRGSYADKVWTADGSGTGEGEHVSERKFVNDEHAEEELIKPMEGEVETNHNPTEVVT
ncbi:MAG: hypothetical protein Q9227_002286 [Pyrenula ochraceoflavens]